MKKGRASTTPSIRAERGFRLVAPARQVNVLFTNASHKLWPAMDELINEFIAETRDMLQALSGAIVAWEAHPGDRERLDEIFRFVHTVKGNCGFFDLPRLEQLSHAAEDALAEVRAGNRDGRHRAGQRRARRDRPDRRAGPGAGDRRGAGQRG